MAAALATTWAYGDTPVVFLVRQQHAQVVGGAGLAEQLALRLVAAGLAQERELLHGLDAFGDHLHAEAVAHLDDGAHQRRVVAVGGGVAHEGLVDLQRADRELLQRRQRGIAGAEVVDGQVQAHGRQLVEHADGALGIGHQGGFGDLEFQAARGDTPWRANTDLQSRMKLAWRSCFSDRFSAMRPGSLPAGASAR